MGDREQVEDLALEVGQLGLEDLDGLAVVACEVVAGGVGELVEDAGGGRRLGGSVLVVERQLADVVAGHRGAQLAFDEALGEQRDELTAGERLDPGGGLQLHGRIHADQCTLQVGRSLTAREAVAAMKAQRVQQGGAHRHSCGSSGR